MLRVMIIDDEGLVRLTLRSFLQDSDYLVCAEAASGEQALALFDKVAPVDILLTDISMPNGDGLHLMERMQEKPNPPLMAVLSAYNDYAYVRKAFKLGAQDYMLKSDMTRESVLQFLDALSQKNALAQEAGPLPPVEKGVYLKAMLDGVLPSTPAQMKEVGITLAGMLVAAFVWIDNFSAVREKYTEAGLQEFRVNVASAVSSVLRDIPGCELLALNPQEYVVLVSGQQHSRKALQDKVNRVLTQLRYCLRAYLNVTASIGLSAPGQPEELPALYASAEFNARMRFVFGKDSTIFPEQVQLVSHEGRFAVLELADGLIAALDAADEEATLKELGLLFHNINLHLGANREKSNLAYYQIVFLLMKYLNEHGASAELVLGKDVDFYSRLQRFETQTELHNWIHNVSRAIVAYFKDQNNAQSRNFVKSAQVFVQKNYAEEISLKTLSAYVGFSESYVSAQFAKMVGESFTDYLIRVRMGRAKELLDTTNLRTYEIAQAVGYVNAEHFIRMFKKHTGFSPGRYRAREK